MGCGLREEENYFWQGNACPRAGHPIPWKRQEGSGEANLRVRCAWVPTPRIVTARLQTQAFKLPSALALSQLLRGAGAPTSVTNHHLPPTELPGVQASMVVILQGLRGHCNPMSLQQGLLWEKCSSGALFLEV